MIDYLKLELDRLDKLIKQAEESLSDPQLKNLAEEEIIKLQKQKQALINSQNIPFRNGTKTKNIPFRNGNVILEIRPGTGGEEAKIWAGDLENMYTRFANSQKLAVIKLDDNVIKIKGNVPAGRAYSLFQYEAGVHRVQRVPATESQGRIHTSTATVAVLPEVKESDVQIKPQDLTIQFFHSSSQGGQNVQKVSTAVRLIHKPSGIITTCQSQRFQDQNRKIALDMLRSKLYQLEKDKVAAQIGAARQIAGHGFRSEKIRTYNFPQNRVTDHRINTSWKQLDRIMEGNLLPVIDKLNTYSPASWSLTLMVISFASR